MLLAEGATTYGAGIAGLVDIVDGGPFLERSPPVQQEENGELDQRLGVGDGMNIFAEVDQFKSEM